MISLGTLVDAVRHVYSATSSAEPRNTDRMNRVQYVIKIAQMSMRVGIRKRVSTTAARAIDGE